ncbi:MAG: hypothetical protein WA742_09405 [Candidatus Cybelea sp.]
MVERSLRRANGCARIIYPRRHRRLAAVAAAALTHAREHHLDAYAQNALQYLAELLTPRG